MEGESVKVIERKRADHEASPLASDFDQLLAH
jgi:hypothetical protein